MTDRKWEELVVKLGLSIHAWKHTSVEIGYRNSFPLISRKKQRRETIVVNNRTINLGEKRQKRFKESIFFMKRL